MTPRYRVLRELGEGGAGRVFLAQDLQTGRSVAVKTLRADWLADGGELLRAEVRLLSRLSHPNLVQVFDYHDAPSPFFTMEAVEGLPLHEAAAKADPATVMDLFAQFCRGLSHLHARGLRHGDVKPSNALVREDGVLKILDFGFSGTSGVTGTPAYMAPEALAGCPGPESDLFSLGKIFAEIFKDRSGFPKPFLSLIDVLMRPMDSRPRSAGALLRYLARHGLAKSDAGTETFVSLNRPPRIDRPEEKFLQSFLERWKQERHMSLVYLSGPTGVGRTRFLEEARMRLQLEGFSDVLFFPDLHACEETSLNDTLLRLRLLSRRPAGPLVFLEFSDDRSTDALKRFLDRTGELPVMSERITLRDWSGKDIRRLVDEVSQEWEPALASGDAGRVAASSGGRPLLALELLRNLRTPTSQAASPKLRNLSEASAALAATLPPESALLLAFLLAHPVSVSASEMEKLWDEKSQDGLWDAQIDLRSAGLLAPDAAMLALAHPALREDYLRGLSAGLISEVRARWIEHLTQAAKSGSSETAWLLAKHALAEGRADVAERWGIAALDHLSRLSRFQEAEDLARRLSELARADLEKALFHAYEATLFYRLGRYEEAMNRYDLWFHLKPDDGTGLNRLKHLLYTGQSLLGLERFAEARGRFEDLLKSGDPAAHPHHRPYQVRARILLASLFEKENDWTHAEALLEEAVPLAEKDPALLGEIEQHRGLIARAQSTPSTTSTTSKDKEALEHLSRALKYFESAGRPQAEALAWDRIGVFHRERGELALALEAMDHALARAEAGGERLQKGRVLANHAEVLADLARYGPALKELEEALDILDVFGTEEDCFLARFNLADLHTKLGLNPAKISGTPPPLPRTGPLAEARDFVSRFFSAAQEPSPEALSAFLEKIASVEAPEIRAEMRLQAAVRFQNSGHLNVSASLLRLALNEYASIHANLPEELKMDFEKRPDLASLDRTLSQLAGPATNVRSLPENRFRQYCEINRQIVSETDPERLLERVIDAAIEITGAERGFLLLKESNAEGPLPGYEVKTARHLSRKTLAEAEFQISLTSVRDALSKLTYIVTDNAQKDPRYQEMKSVMDYQLKSILVVPLEAGGEAIGAVYLDHRYRPDCFSEQDVLFLSAFATQAAMALQKARMIEELSEAQKHLESKVEQQTVQIENLREELTRKRSDLRYGYEDIVGQSPPMMKVFNLLDRVTETTIPVWVHGESGTGKELVARSLHFNSLRKKGPFVAENVSAIPETLLESELFGHKKGAFTHATQDRVGLLEQASGGTLFLDEIADMSAAMQAKLLRVLQEGEVRPVGSPKKVKIDVRLVTASNGDLREMVEAGKFRKDLFFRINGLTIELPALRERRADIPLLAKSLIEKISKEFQLPLAAIAPEALETLLRHPWPGNVRELEATLRNALLFANGQKITTETLGILQNAPGSSAPVKTKAAPRQVASEKAQAPDEREMILAALKRQKMDKPAAAKALNMCLKTLYVRMDALGIPKKKPLLAQYLGISEGNS